MVNVGAQLGQTYQTSMPAMGDVADIQQALMMLWYGDPNATGPTSKGVEKFLSDLNADIATLAAKKTTDVIFSATAPARNTDSFSNWIWVDTSTVNPDGASRPVRIWNGSAWSLIAGAADPSANYTWSGTHTFNNSVTIKSGINSFASTTARTAAIPSPANGTLSFVGGKYEFYKDGAWVSLGTSERVVETRGTTSSMVETDVFKILNFNSSSASTYTINTNQVKVGSSVAIYRSTNTPLTIAAGSGVVLNAQTNVLGQYAVATLTKVATDSWVLEGSGSGLPSGGTIGSALVKSSNADYDYKWEGIVPSSGGTFTGPVTVSGSLNASTLTSGDASFTSGGIKIGGKRIFVQSTIPNGMSAGDVWIQT